MLVADVAIKTGIGPADLLAAPPEVFEAIVIRLNDQAEAEQRQHKKEELRSRLRKSAGR